MRTNFYLLGNDEVDDIHLGKQFDSDPIAGRIGFIWALHREDAARLIVSTLKSSSPTT